MTGIKRDLILNASNSIVKFLDDRYAIDVDPLDIACYINDDLGFIFNALEETLSDQDE